MTELSSRRGSLRWWRLAGDPAGRGKRADAEVYLCSERASFITGHDLVADGGVLVRSNVIDL